MSWSRRELLSAAAALAVSSTTLGRLARAHNRGDKADRPRALVQIFLAGGLDPILTTDPKRRSQVASQVDVPYGEKSIVRAGEIELGPLLEPLRRYASSMAVVNGVACSTVSHQTGFVQNYQQRRVFPRQAGGLTGTVGAVIRRDAPLADVRYLGVPLGNESPQKVGRSLSINATATDPDPSQGLLHQLAGVAADKDQRAAVLAELARQQQSCAERSECVPIQATRELLERMPPAPLPAPKRYPDPDPDVRVVAEQWSSLFRDALFLLQHELTHSIYLSLQPAWDTHYWNLHYQKLAMAQFLPPFLHFLEQLDALGTRDGMRLSKQTGILLGSELGRFPVLNEFDGKDHFPECPAILIGPGIKAGQYGATDNMLTARPISLKSGKAARTNGIAPTIDDIGASVLHWFGIEDTASLGYLGKRLDFLFL